EAILYPACECGPGLLWEGLQRSARGPLTQLVLEPSRKFAHASFYPESPVWAWEVGPLILGAGDVDWLLETIPRDHYEHGRTDKTTLVVLKREATYYLQIVRRPCCWSRIPDHRCLTLC